MTIRYVLHPSSNFSPNYNSVTGALADAVSGDEIHIHNSNIDALLVIRYYIDNSQVVLAFNENQILGFNQNLGFDQILNNSSANFLKSTNNIYYNRGSVMVGPESVFYTTSVAAFNEAFKLKVHGGAKFQAGNIVVGTATEIGTDFSEHLRIDTYGNIRIGLTEQTLLTINSSNGNLMVTGTSVLNNNITATATLNVSGMTTLLGDATAVARFNVSGESTLLGNATLVSQLNVSGETTLLGNTTAVARFNVSGETTLLGNTTAVARFNVSGESTLLGNTTIVSQLNVSGESTLLGNTTAVARFNVSGESTLLGNTTAVARFNVSGETTLLGNTTLVSQLNVSGKTTFQGDMTALSQMNLLGDFTYSGNMIKNGFTMMSWFDNSMPSQAGSTTIIPTSTQNYYGCYIDVQFSSSKVYSYIMQSNYGPNIINWTIAGSNDRTTWYLLDNIDSNTGINYNTSGPFRNTQFTYVRFLVRRVDGHYNVMCQRFCLFDENGSKINISLYDAGSWNISSGIAYYQGNWSNPVNSDNANNMYLGSNDYQTYNNGWDGSYIGNQYTTMIPSGTLVINPTIIGQARMYNLAQIGVGISAPTNMLSVSGTTFFNGEVSMTTTLNVSGETTLLGNMTAVGRLNVSGESTLLGNATMMARFNVSGESVLLGNTTLVSQLNVSGETTLLGNTTTVSNFNVSGETTLLGNMTAVARFNVSGESTLLGNATMMARFNVSGESTLLGNATLVSQLNVSGESTLLGNTTAVARFNVSGESTLLGCTTLVSQLNVSGESTLLGCTTAVARLNVSGESTLLGNTTAMARFNVSGESTLLGNATLVSQLNVSGETTLLGNTTAVARFNVSGETTLLGNTTLVSQLNVSGESTLLGNTTLVSRFNVSGESTLLGNTTLVSQLNVSGETTLFGNTTAVARFNISGESTLLGNATMMARFNVSGESTLLGNTTIVSQLNVSGESTLLGNMTAVARFNVSGESTLLGCTTLVSQLNVSGESTLLGNMTAVARLNVSGESTLLGNTTAMARFNVSGESVLLGNATFVSQLNVSGETTLLGNTTAVARFNVSGESTLLGNITAVAQLNVSGMTTLLGNTTLVSQLNVSGESTLLGNTTIVSQLNVSGESTLFGNTTAVSRFNVSGESVLLGNATMMARFNVSGESVLLGNATLVSQLNVSGETTLFGNATAVSRFNVSGESVLLGNATLVSQLNVSGETTLFGNATAVSRFNVSGESTLLGNATLVSQLNVSGMTTLLGNTTLVSQLNVSGESVLLGNTTLVSQLNVSGETTLFGNSTAVARFNVSGESTLLGNTTMVARFNVSGESTLLGNTTMVSQLNVSGETTLLGNTTIVSRLNVSGETTLLGNVTAVGRFNVSGQTTLFGDVTMVASIYISGDTYMSGSFNMGGKMVLGGNMSINGDSSVLGAVTQSSTLNVSGTTTFQGNVTALSQMNLLGDFTYSGNMIKNGFTMMSWFDNTIPSQPGTNIITPNAEQNYYGCYIDVNFGSSKIYSYVMQSSSSANIIKWTIAGSNDRTTWYLLDNRESNTGSSYNTSGPFRDTQYTYVRFIVRKVNFHYNVMCERFCLYDQNGTKINISLFDDSSWAASSGIAYYQGNWNNPVNSDTSNNMYLGSNDYSTYNNGWDGSYTGSQYTAIIPSATITTGPPIPLQARMYNLAQIGIGMSAPTNMLSVSGTTLFNGAVTMTSTLNVSGETTLLGNATAVGRLNVSGESTLLGNTTAMARFNVSGESTLLGNITAVAQLNVSGESTLLGNMTAVARFNVSGESTLLGNTTLVSQLNVSGMTTLLGNTTIVSQLNVSGMTTLLGNTTIVSQLNVSGMTTLLGNTTIVSQLNVSGMTTLLGNTTAVARFNVSGETTLLGNTTMVSQLNVSGMTTLEGAVTSNSTVNINGTMTVLKKVQNYTFDVGSGGAAGTGDYAAGGGAGGIIVRQNNNIINPSSIATRGADSNGGSGYGGIGFGAGGGGGDANVVSVSGISIAGEWMQFDLGSAMVIQTYGLGNWGMDKEIGTWTLAGSTDNSTWYTIDTRVQVTPAHYAFTTYTSAGSSATSSFRYIRLIVQGLKQQPYYYGSTLQFTFYLRDSASNFLQTSPSNTATYSANLGNTTGYFYMSANTGDVYPNNPGAGPSGAGYYYATNDTYTGPVSTTITTAFNGEYVQFDVGTPTIIRTYGTYSDNSASYPLYTWALVGSNSASGPYSIVDHHSSGDKWGGPSTHNWLDFTTTQTTAYRYYRLIFLSFAGGYLIPTFFRIRDVNGSTISASSVSLSSTFPTAGSATFYINGNQNNYFTSTPTYGGGGSTYIGSTSTAYSTGSTTITSLAGGNGSNGFVYIKNGEIEYFTQANTSYTFTAPGTTKIIMMGGGGSGGNNSSANNMSSGGGGAGYIQIYDMVVSSGQTANITIGNGGTAPVVVGGFRFNVYTSGYFNDDTNWFLSQTPSSTGLVTDMSNIGTSTNGIVPTNSSWNNYSVEWFGYFRAPTTGTYTFYTASDDASYLWVGANANSGYTAANSVVNNGGGHGVEERSGTISLVAGATYPIRIQFGEGGGGDNCIVSFAGPGISKTSNFNNYVTSGTVTDGEQTVVVINSITYSANGGINGATSQTGGAGSSLGGSGKTNSSGALNGYSNGMNGQGATIFNTITSNSGNMTILFASNSGVTASSLFVIGASTASSTFNVSGESTLLGNTTAMARLNVSGESTLLGNVTLVSQLNVSGMTTLLGNTTAVGRFNVSGESTLLGNTTLVSQLNVSGETTLLGCTTAVSRFNVSGESTLLGNTTLVSQLNVSGETTLLGCTTAVSRFNVSGMTTLLGATTLVSTLNISGNSVMLGPISANSTLNVSGESILLGNTTLMSQLNVSGMTTLLGNTTIVSQLNVSGESTLLGNTTMVSQLNVSGESTLLGNTTLVSQLNVSGESTLLGNMTAVARFNVSGESTLLGNTTMVSQLNVSGMTTLLGNTTAVARLNVSGESTLLGNTTLVSQLNVSGMTTLLGNTTAVARFNVSGESTLLGNATLVSQLNVSGKTTMQGDVTMLSQFNLLGDITYSGNMIKNGFTMMSWFDNTIPSQPGTTIITPNAAQNYYGCYIDVNFGSSKIYSYVMQSNYGPNIIKWTIAGSNDRNTWYLLDSPESNTGTNYNTSGPFIDTQFTYVRFIVRKVDNHYNVMCQRFCLYDENGTKINISLFDDSSWAASSGIGYYQGTWTNPVNSDNANNMYLGSNDYSTYNNGWDGTYKGSQYTAIVPSGTITTSQPTPAQARMYNLAEIGIGMSAPSNMLSVSGTTLLNGVVTMTTTLNVSGETTLLGNATAVGRLNVSGESTLLGNTTAMARFNVSGESTLLGNTTAVARFNVSGESTLHGNTTLVSRFNVSGESTLLGCTTLVSQLNVSGMTTLLGATTAMATLNVSGESTLLGNTTLVSQLNVSGMTTLLGSVTAVNTFNVSGESTLLGNVTMVSQLNVSGMTTLLGNTTLVSQLDVSGKTTLLGSVTAVNTLNVSGETTLLGNTTAVSRFNVSGESTLLGNVTMMARMNVSGETTLLGYTTLVSRLDVSGMTTLLGSVTAVNTLNVSGESTLLGNTTLVSQLNVSGETTLLGSVTAMNTLNVSGESTLLGNTTLVSQLNVSGKTTLLGSVTAMNTLNVSGETTLLGNVTLVSQLNVSGESTLLGCTTAVARFNVSGESTLLGNTTAMARFNVSGESTLLGCITAVAELNVSGESTFLGNVTAVAQLNVSGMTTLLGSVTAVARFNVSGESTLLGCTTLVSQLNVSGMTTMLGATTAVATLNVSGESTLLGNTTVVARLNVSGMTTMLGAVTAMNTLNVSGESTLQGAVTMLATLNVSGNTTLLGPLTSTSTINISGDSTLQGDVTGLASLNISGITMLNGAATLGSTLSVMGDTRVNTIRPYADTITGPSVIDETINIIGHYINIGNSNSVISILGTTTSILTNQIVVEDPLIVINSNAGPVYNVLGNDSGIEISAISSVGYIKTNSDATKFGLKAPQSSDIGYIVTKDNNDNLVITGTTTIKDATTMLSSLNVSGMTTLLGDTTVMSQLNVSGMTILLGNVTLMSQLNVSGESTLFGNITAVAQLNVSGMTALQGATTLMSTLNVSGMTILLGNTTVASQLTVSGVSTLQGNTTAVARFNVSGETTLLGNTTLVSQLNVSGTTTHQGAVTLLSSLNVSGMSNMLGNVTLVSQLNVSGVTTHLGAVTLLSSLNVSGVSSLLGNVTLVSQLNVSGMTALHGNTTIVSQLNVSGMSTFLGNTTAVARFNVSGMTSLQGASTLLSSLNVSGQSSLLGNVTLVSQLNVSGMTVLQGASTINSTLNVSGKSLLQGSTTVLSILSVSGVTIIGNAPVDLTTALTVNNMIKLMEYGLISTATTSTSSITENTYTSQDSRFMGSIPLPAGFVDGSSISVVMTGTRGPGYGYIEGGSYIQDTTDTIRFIQLSYGYAGASGAAVISGSATTSLTSSMFPLKAYKYAAYPGWSVSAMTLDVTINYNGSAQGISSSFQQVSTQGGYNIVDNLNTTTRVTINPSGNVGIGNSNPVYRFDVAGNNNIAMNIAKLNASDKVGMDYSVSSTGISNEVAYARTYGGITTASQNGYYAIDLLNSGTFASTLDVATSHLYMTTSQTWIKTKIGAGNMTSSGSNKVIVSDGTGYMTPSGITTTTLNYLDATSSVQTQFNTLANTLTNLSSFKNPTTALSSFNVSGNTTLQGPITGISTLNISGNTTLQGTAYIGGTLSSGTSIYSYSNAGVGNLKLTSYGNSGGDKWWIGFGHDGIAADSNDRARIGVEVRDGGSGRLYFNTGAAPSVERMRLDENGYLGIGTSSPQTFVDINNSSNPKIYLTNSTSRAFLSGIPGYLDMGNDAGTSSVIRFMPNGSESIRITNNGSMGIGTTNPASLLDVRGTISAGTLNVVNSGAIANGGYVSIVPSDSTHTGYVEFKLPNTNRQGYIGYATTSQLELMGDNGSALALGAGGSYRMFINTNGNVGIGTSNPITTRKVSILGTGGTTNMIAHYKSDNAVPYVASGYDETNDGYALMTNQSTTDVNTTAMFIKRTTNNIGMGTTAPDYPLDIINPGLFLARFKSTAEYARIILDGAIGTGADIIYKANGVSQYGIAVIGGNMQFLLNDSTTTVPMTLSSGGLVGIGTTTPGAMLHVSGTTILRGAVSTNSTLNVSGTAVLANATTMLSTLYVSGTSYLNNNITINQQSSSSITPALLFAKTSDDSNGGGLGFYYNANAVGNRQLCFVDTSFATKNTTNNMIRFSNYIGISGMYIDSISTDGSTIRPLNIGGNSLILNHPLIHPNQYVGISTATPSATLHVSGNTKLEGATTIGSTLNVIGALTSNSTLNVAGNTFVAGTMSIGTTANSFPLTINSGSNPCKLALLESSTGNNYITFNSNALARGYVGLENSSGSGLFGSNSAYGMSIGTNQNGGALAFATNNVIRTTIDTSGNMGIGTSAPSTSYSSTIPNARLSILSGVAGADGGTSRLSIGGDNNHYAAIEGTHVGGGSTTLALMTAAGAGVNSSNPLTRLFIDSTGKVGINTTSMSALLHVNGTSIISGAITMGSTLNVVSAVSMSSTLNVSGNTSIRGNVAIGSATAVVPLDVNGTILARNYNVPGYQGAYMGWNRSGGTGEVNLMCQQGLGIGGFSFELWNNSNTIVSTLMVINGNNNFVGINNTAPSAMLDVNGTMLARGAFTTNSTLFAAGAATMASTLRVSGNTSVMGTMAIGISAPTSIMQIHSALVSGTTGLWEAADLRFTYNAGGGSMWDLGRISGYVAANANNDTANWPGGLLFQTKPPTTIGALAITRMVIDSNGMVGVGTTAPLALHHVSGTSLIGGAMTARSTLVVNGAMTCNSTLNVSGLTTFVGGTTIKGFGISSFPSLSISSDQTSRFTMLFNVTTANSGVAGSSVGDTILCTGDTAYPAGNVYIQRTTGFNPVLTATVGGSVGINNVTPSANLHVIGTTILQGAASVTSTLNVSSTSFLKGTVTINSTLNVVSTDSNTAITTLLNFKNTSGYGIYADSQSVNNRGNTLDFKGYDYNSGGIATQNILTLRPEGTIGMGTLAPISNLHINGSGATALTISNNINNLAFQVGVAAENGNYSGSAVAGDSVIRTINNKLLLQTGSGNCAMAINSNNYVGIGTNNPTSFLTVVGGNPTTETTSGPYTAEFKGVGSFDGCTVVRINNNASQYGRAHLQLLGRSENNNDAWDLTNGRTSFQFQTQITASSAITTNFALQNYGITRFGILSSYNIGVPALAITGNNNYVGIGTDTPLASLHVSGTTLIANAMTAASTLNVMGSTVLMNTLNVGISSNKGIIQSYNQTTTRQHNMTLTGAEYYEPNNWSSTEGIGLTLGVNRPGNRQLWIMDTALAVNTTNTAFRLIPGNGYIDAVSTDGTTGKVLTFGNNTGVVMNGPITAVSSMNVSGTMTLSSGINMTGLPNTTSNNNYVLTYNNSTGALGYNGFYVTQLFNNQSSSWSGGVTSSNVTLGANSKMIQGTVTYYVTAVVLAQVSLIFTPVGGGTAYTFNFNKYFNNTYAHTEHTFTLALTNAQLPAGTYTCQAIKSGANSGNMASDTNDQIMIAITNYPN